MVASILAIACLITFVKPKERELPEMSGAVVVRLAHFPNITHAPALVGLSRGELQASVAPNRTEVKVVNAGPEAMEALLANEIDIAFVGPSPAINTFIKSEGQALRVIAGACSGGASLVVAPGSGIGSLRDLTGKRVATPQLGNTQDISLRHFISREGLSPFDKGGTVRIMPIKNPDILTQFKLGELDAAWVPEPWATRLVVEAGAKRLIDERDLWPNRSFPTTVIVVRTAFLNEHRELVDKIVRANAKVIEWMGAHPTDAKSIANLELKRLTGKELAAAVLDESWEHLDFMVDPQAQCFSSFLSAAVECGFIKNPPASLEGLFVTLKP